jgi:aryl-alcohol dehydrogenase-like predicted oxidoreductase
MAVRNPDGIPRWDKIPRHYEGASAKVLREGIEGSLKRLKTDFIDLYYIHVDDRETNLEETLAAMDAFVKEGKIRYIGYSNIQTWRLERVFRLCEENGWTKPVAIQQEYSYVNPAKYGEHVVGIHAKEEFFDWMRDVGTVGLVAYSPLLKGIYCDEEKRKAALADPDYDTAVTRKRLARIDAVSARLGVHPGALVLAWMARKEEGIFPILGFSRKEQYLEDIGCLGIELDDETMAELGA